MLISLILTGVGKVSLGEPSSDNALKLQGAVPSPSLILNGVPAAYHPVGSLSSAGISLARAKKAAGFNSVQGFGWKARALGSGRRERVPAERQYTGGP